MKHIKEQDILMKPLMSALSSFLYATAMFFIVLKTKPNWFGGAEGYYFKYILIFIFLYFLNILVMRPLFFFAARFFSYGFVCYTVVGITTGAVAFAVVALVQHSGLVAASFPMQEGGSIFWFSLIGAWLMWLMKNLT